MDILTWARKVQALAQSGLTFTQDAYDRERYEELQHISAAVLAAQLGETEESLKRLFVNEQGYATPKVDVRGAVFRDDTILLVRERADGLWTLPGGWADVNDAPSEAVVREVHEESGFHTRAVKLAAVYDRNRHPHPPMLFHVYKLFFLCDIVGGHPTISLETDGVGFYALAELPQLSTSRVTEGQIKRLFDHYRHPDLPTDFD